MKDFLFYLKSKNLGGKSHRREVDGYYTELHRRMNQDQADSTQYGFFTFLFN
jgi:hypothetical protein